MENLQAAPTTRSPREKLNRTVQRLRRIRPLFIWTVVVPTLVATIYFALIASDIYVSEARFVVRSPQRQTQGSFVGALLQGTGFSRAQDDTYPIIDYIQSRDALTELNKGDYIVEAYGEHGDFVSRFHRALDGSFESLWKYYGKHIVSVDFDATSAITTLQVRAFTAGDAEKINQTLLRISERLINRMNDRATADTIQFAQRQVDAAAAKAKDAAAALATYRDSYTVFDPERQSALLLQQVSGLQAQVFAAQTQLTQLQAISPDNPQVPVIKSSIATLQKQIAQSTSGVTGGSNSLSGKAAGYARLQLESQFSDRQLASAMSSLDSARGQADQKQLYLERLVEPNEPDIAIEPKRFRGILTVLVLGLVAWATLSLLVASIREHRD